MHDWSQHKLSSEYREWLIYVDEAKLLGNPTRTRATRRRRRFSRCPPCVSSVELNFVYESLQVLISLEIFELLESFKPLPVETKANLFVHRRVHFRRLMLVRTVRWTRSWGAIRWTSRHFTLPGSRGTDVNIVVFARNSLKYFNYVGFQRFP